MYISWERMRLLWKGSVYAYVQEENNMHVGGIKMFSIVPFQTPRVHGDGDDRRFLRLFLLFVKSNV